MTFPYTGGIPLTSFITTTGSTDTFPTHVDFLGYGGYSAVADVTARNAITSQRRSFGMQVCTQSDGQVYKLCDIAMGGTSNTLTDNSNWIAVSSGGGIAIGADVSGGTAHDVLFVDASGKLGQDNNFTYNNGALTILSSGYAGHFIFGNAGDLYNDGFGNVTLTNTGHGQQLAFSSTGAVILQDSTGSSGGLVISGGNVNIRQHLNLAGLSSGLMLYLDASGNVVQNAAASSGIGVAYEYNNIKWHLPTTNPDYLGVVMQPTSVTSTDVVLGWSFYIHDGAGVTSYDIPNRQIIDNGGFLSIDGVGRSLCNASGASTILYGSYQTLDSSGVQSMNYNGRDLTDGAGSVRYDWENGYFYDSSGRNVADFSSNRTLFDSNGSPINYFGQTPMVWQSGDVGSLFNETIFTIDDNAQIATITAFGGKYLSIDRANDQYGIGDLSNYTNGGQLFIDNVMQTAVIGFQGNPYLGINRDSLLYSIGDYTGATNSTYFQVNDNAVEMYANIPDGSFYIQRSFGDAVAKFNTQNNSVYIGDLNSANNSTSFTVDDPDTLIIATTSGQFLVQTTSGQPAMIVFPVGYITYIGDSDFNSNGTVFKVNDTSLAITGQTDGVFQVTDATGNYQLFTVDQSAGVPIVSSGDVGENFNLTRWIVDDQSQVINGILTGQMSILDTGGNPFLQVDTIARQVTVWGNNDFIVNAHEVTGNPGGAPTTNAGTLVHGSTDTAGIVQGCTSAASVKITFGAPITGHQTIVPAVSLVNSAGPSQINIMTPVAGTNSFIVLFSPALTGGFSYHTKIIQT